jgi:hypothetical protein
MKDRLVMHTELKDGKLPMPVAAPLP